MDRHHIVPQFLLQRFANEDGRLRALDRTGLDSAHLTSVRNACREAGYYRIETEDLEEWAREGHDPELAEKALSGVESDAADIIANIIAGKLPRTEADRLHLALFVALQMTRGWQFRDEINQIGTLRRRQELESRRDELTAKARAWLRRQGRPAGPGDVEKYLDHVQGPNGPQLVINDAVRVQASLRHALYNLAPMLLERHLRILRFDKPSLVVSDAPVGTWAPGQDRAVGVGNAALVFLPLSRQVALAYGAKVRTADTVVGQTRAAQINFLAADGAVRWVYEHPTDWIVETLDIPADRPKWVTEFLAGVDEPGGFRRELWQHVRR
jgi:Protein of unknown function (DUF4238)